MSRYYEVTGITRTKILDVLKDRDEVEAAAMTFAKKYGATNYVHTSGGFVVRVVGFVFPDTVELDPKLFRKKYNKSAQRHEDWYVPNRKSAAGRKLKKEMDSFRFPGGEEIAGLIGMKVWSEAKWRIPGVTVLGAVERVIVKTPDGFNPRRKELTRVSDVDVEGWTKFYARATKKRKGRKKKKKARKRLVKK